MHRTESFASDQYLIINHPMVFAIYAALWICTDSNHCYKMPTKHISSLIHLYFLFFHLENSHLWWRFALQWGHNERDGVSNHQPHDCLLNRLFRHRSKKTSSFASLAFVRGIHRWPVNSPHKGPIKRKMFPFDDIIMVSWDTPTQWCVPYHTAPFIF